MPLFDAAVMPASYQRLVVKPRHTSYLAHWMCTYHTTHQLINNCISSVLPCPLWAPVGWPTSAHIMRVYHEQPWVHFSWLPAVMILILMTMFTVLSSWRGHCESSPGSFDECRLSARWLPTPKLSQTTWVVSPPVGCYHPHPPSPFISITQPESWYSFYRPTEGGRLSRPRHCRKGAQPVPKAVHHSSYRDKHDRGNQPHYEECTFCCAWKTLLMYAQHG